MQTRDEVEGLHNCREFSQPLSCLYQAMQTQEKRFLLLNYVTDDCKALFFVSIFNFISQFHKSSVADSSATINH